MPALRRTLREKESFVTIAAGFALARIDAGRNRILDRELETWWTHRLDLREVQGSEMAALALGLAGSRRAIDLLIEVARDTREGRWSVNRDEVPLRLRAFAVHALGLAGRRLEDADLQVRLADEVAEILGTYEGRNPELPIACVLTLAHLPLLSPHSFAARHHGCTPGSCGARRIEFLLSLLESEHRCVVKAHVPTAVMHLLDREPAPWSEARTRLLLDDFHDRLAERAGHECLQLREGIALAVARGCDLGDDRSDREMRKLLMERSQRAGLPHLRGYAILALGRLRTGLDREGHLVPTSPRIRSHLFDLLQDEDAAVRGWAGLAVGLLGRRLEAEERAPEEVVRLATRLCESLRGEENSLAGGGMAMGAALLRDEEAAAVMVEKLRVEESGAGGAYVALALGMLGGPRAVGTLRAIVADPRSEGDLLRQASLALGVLGDAAAVPVLVARLGAARSIWEASALVEALDMLGDRSAIPLLLDLLADRDRSDLVRSHAAAALGLVADPTCLPGNAEIARDLNYRASSPGLNRPEGWGLLNIL